MRRSLMMFLTLSERTTRVHVSGTHNHTIKWRTFILADVFEGKCKSRIFPFNNANFAKSSLADDSEQSEVVQIDCLRESD